MRKQVLEDGGLRETARGWSARSPGTTCRYGAVREALAVRGDVQCTLCTSTDKTEATYPRLQGTPCTHACIDNLPHPAVTLMAICSPSSSSRLLPAAAAAAASLPGGVDDAPAAAAAGAS